MVSKVQACLKRLSKVNRQIVVQRVQQDLSYREIAEALGLTSEQVRLRFYRASQTIRSQCEHASELALGGGGRVVVTLVRDLGWLRSTNLACILTKEGRILS